MRTAADASQDPRAWYRPGPKLLFTLIRLFTGRPVPDAARFVFYRPEFYSSYKFTHEAMRGRSAWSVAERELMAAYVSKMNECPFCVGAHSATATQAYEDEAMVAAVLNDIDGAPIQEGLRQTLRMLGKLTRERRLTAADVRPVLAAGVSREQIEDAFAVGFAFNVTNRLANAFGFELLSPEDYRAGAKYLLKRGYR